MTNEPLRVLICDDHTLFRDGLRALLTSAPDTELVGEATTGEEAVECAAALQPDVVIMDIQMPGINGIEATRRILNASPHIKILVVTMFEDENSVFLAMRAGALGYVLKGAKHDEMLRAIRAVAGGEAIFSPAIATRLIDFFSRIPPTLPRQIFPELTEREREVLGLVAQGHRNAEIAQRLVVSDKTVRNHVSNILSKLQASDRTEAAIRAREAGMG